MNREEYRELHRLVRSHLRAAPFTTHARHAIDASLLAASVFVDRKVVSRYPRRGVILQAAIRTARNRGA